MATGKSKTAPKKATTAEIADSKETLKKPLAFVIMPFTRVVPSRIDLRWQKPELDEDNLTTIYECIHDALDDAYTVERSQGPGDIMAQIIFKLHTADLVVADLSGLNPNVLYELGIRHTFFQKKTLILTQDRAELPFDVHSKYSIEYRWINNTDRCRLRNDIRAQLWLIKESPNAYFGPVEPQLQVGDYASSLADKRYARRRWDALFREVSSVADTIFAMFDAFRLDSPRAIKGEEECLSVHCRALSRAIDSDVMSTWMRSLPAFIGDLPCVELYVTDDYLPEDVVTNAEREALRSVMRGLRPQFAYMPETFLHDMLMANELAVALLVDALAVYGRLNGESSVSHHSFVSGKVSSREALSRMVMRDVFTICTTQYACPKAYCRPSAARKQNARKFGRKAEILQPEDGLQDDKRVGAG